MGLLFKDDLHDEFGRWLLAYIGSGGPEFGEIAAIGAAVGDGDDSAFHAAFLAYADRLAEEAEAAEQSGRLATARELWLRISAVLSASYHPLYGSPTDSRLLAAWRRQIAAMERGLALGETPAVRLDIPFEGAVMPAWFLPAPGKPPAPAPLLIVTGGYDSTVTDSLFATAFAAGRRGYAVLLFDGPGQGGMLYEQGLPMRPDWETVVSAVLDVAVTLPGIDPARIALSGWSLGGYLAPRAAAGESRLAALIADPLLPSLADGFRGMAMKFGASPEQVADLARLDPALAAMMEEVIRKDPVLDWKIVRRAFWVHGIASLAEYAALSEAYTLEGRFEAIRCPTLVTIAENDPLARAAPAAFERLTCPKALLRFTAAEGAGDHCEMGNRAALNRRAFDWLDDVFAGRFG